MPHTVGRCLPWVILLLLFRLSGWGQAAEPAARPEAWATKIERPGLPNLFQVNETLYRGAQPTAEGVAELRKLGVRTIVNLRSSHSDQKLLGETGIVVEAIPTSPWDINDEDVISFLKIVTEKKNQPVFVHCQHGADRTGTMCAAYRVVVEGWPKQQAIDEMTNGGFGFHSVWVNLPSYIENLDVEKIRTEAGLGK